ncbi:MAG: YIP1 family protein [Candidatus Anammoxibacter sp.]
MINTFTCSLNDIILKPKLFFSNMGIDGGYKDPLIFSYIVFFSVTALGFILYLLGMPQMVVLVDLNKELSANQLFSLFFLRAIAWGGGLFLVALMYHIGFKIVGGSGSYEATFRIVTYTSATYIFNLIPRIGILIYCLFSLYLVIVGGNIVHKVPFGKAMAGPLIPILFIVFLSAIVQSFR